MVAQPEPGSKLRLKLFIEKPKVDEAYRELYRELSGRGGVPGFRPGHVPPWRARRHYGADVIDGGVFADLLEAGLRAALVYGDFHAIEAAGFEEEQTATEGQPLQIETAFEVRPEAHFPDFSGLEFEAPDPEPTAEQIDEEIRRLRDTAADEVEVERREVQVGDLVDVTLKTRIVGEEEGEAEEDEEEGEELEALEALEEELDEEDWEDEEAEEGRERQESFIVGESRYDPPVDTHLLGHSVGETVDFEVSYPDRESMGSLAGKTVAMTATLTALRERRVPELDDDFAAKAADVPTVADLREKIVAQLRDKNRELAREVLRVRAIDWLGRHTRVDLPASLDRDVEESRQRDPEDPIDPRLVRDEARASLRAFIACQAILDQRGVKIEDSEVRDEYVAWGESVGLDAETLRREKLPEELARTVRERVIRRKAVDLIVDAAAPKYLPWSEFLTRHEEEDESPAESAEGEGQTVPMEEPAHEE